MLKQPLLVVLSVLLLGATGSAFAGSDPTLVGWWWFDEGSGTMANDSSSYGNHGTLTNGPVWVEGVFGTALQFDGVDDYVLVPHDTSLTVSTEVAIAVWINPKRYVGPTGDPWQGIIGKQEGQRSYSLYTYTDSTLHFSTVGQGTLSTGKVALNEWSHVCAMVKAGTHVYYVNGQDGGTSGSIPALPGAADTTDVVIGRTNEGTSRSWWGMLDDVRIYNRSLSKEEVQEIMTGNDLLTGQATAPAPADTVTDVPQDAVLGWNAGEYAATHDVYFGDNKDDVTNATRTSSNGVLASQSQAELTYDPDGLLEFGKTYYWRVDEVNAAPADKIFTGTVWSFTVEPFAYPITNVTATASSVASGANPQNTVNGSGLNADDQHSIELKDMWMSSGVKPNWIQYEFDKAYKLGELWVWNSNQMIEAFIGFGAKTVTIEYSTDGQTWTTLENVPEFAKATGAATYTHNTTVDFGGVVAKYVKLTIEATWGGLAQTGLSEVRFHYIPVEAREPVPADGAMDVSLAATLNWRPGREATSHAVYFGTDSAAVTGGTVAAKTVTGHTYTPTNMEYGVQYFWRVDEVGDAGTYAGGVWSYTSQEFAIAEDFESYNDDDNRIYNAWLDGMGTGSSNSTVGYMEAPFAERSVVHSPSQSMPLAYDNTTSPYISETEREFEAAQNWTGSGASEVCVWTRGYPAPTAVAVTETGGKMSVTGAGADIWNNSDEFTYAYKTLTGDGTLIARVVSTGTGTNTWAKGGVMIRDSVNGGSMQAMMAITTPGTNGASFQYRTTTNGASATADSATVVAAPYWVKVERFGSTLTGFHSADGKTWTTVGTASIEMADPVLIGLAVTSHAVGENRTYEFDNITATGTITGNWQGAIINAVQFNDPAGMYLTVEDSAGKSATVTSDTAALTAAWTRWAIPMSDFAGV
ncbi:MAG: LamG-like jellyroll fold domain-containing protein, partial [Solirubrobacterales bacterium]